MKRNPALTALLTNSAVRSFFHAVPYTIYGLFDDAKIDAAPDADAAVAPMLIPPRAPNLAPSLAIMRFFQYISRSSYVNIAIEEASNSVSESEENEYDVGSKS